MLDETMIPAHWGIRPTLFQLMSFPISSYSFFVILGLIVGSIVYFREARKANLKNERTFLIAIAALFGGTIGAKIPIWLAYFPQITTSTSHMEAFLSGRTIVGGLIGGLISVAITKRVLKIKAKRGNLFAPAIALGLAIGRIGCFLQGCSYGIATNLPWGVDFGDGVLRHPTQLYEGLFMLGMFFYLQFAKKKITKPGQLLQIFLISYFVFRFLLEFIKYEPKTIGYFTIYQVIAVVAIIYLLRVSIFKHIGFQVKSNE